MFIKNKKIIFSLVLLALSACSISYKFNGATIDYSKTKSISIAEFTNIAELVYAPLTIEFTDKLRDVYTKNTRLQILKKNGDLQLEGEIVEYTLTPMAISADTYATQTKLTVTINVRFVNNSNQNENFEKRYSAFQTFDSNQMLNNVQDELIKLIIADITDNIFNDTVAQW
ncbi:MAG: LPS assembly lipoprotein LptE [Paludibacter sp.]|jgi:hypothetical protein|nr:LPS assembly lipoprotein LptE [Paludibacter sp.]